MADRCDSCGQRIDAEKRLAIIRAFYERPLPIDLDAELNQLRAVRLQPPS